MLEFLSLKEKAFGMDINDLSLKIVNLEKRRKGFDLVSANRVSIPNGIIENGLIKDEKSLIDIIKSACAGAKGKKIKTKYVAVSLPEEKSFLQVIQMPKMKEGELKTAVPIEVENYIPLPVEDVYLDYKVIPSLNDYLNRLEVFIVAMPKNIVDSYVSCIKKAGLIPVLLEVEGESIVRMLLKNETVSLPVIVVDIGEDSTEFIVFSGNSIRFTSSISIASNQLTVAVSEALGVSVEKAEDIKIKNGLLPEKSDSDSAKSVKAMQLMLDDLAQQISKYINFYREHSSYEYFLPDGKTEKIIFCGAGSNLKGLTDFMTKKIGVKIEIANPFNNLIAVPKKIVNTKDEQLYYTTAAGLCLRSIYNKEDIL